MEALVAIALEVSVGYSGPRRSLRVAGEVDVSNASILADAISFLCDGRGDAILDLTDLRFIDSNGIGVIVRAAKEFASNDRRMTIRPSRPVERVIDLMGLAHLPSLDLERVGPQERTVNG
jgi:anti-anti-sigma factor